jgi:hypothetical protein
MLERASPNFPATPMPPSLAYNCLKSVPLHPEAAAELMEFLKPTFEWQSTLDYLKHPPDGYLSEPVDLMAGLDEIATRVKTGDKYGNMWDFLEDFKILTSRTRDFHFGVLIALAGLFEFQWQVDLVSISDDGRAPPQIFLRGEKFPVAIPVAQMHGGKKKLID